jgi:hypothetical protein
MAETVDSLLSSYTPEVRSIAFKARALILEMIPEAIEQIDIPARMLGYGYERTYTASVCALALQKSYVNLMFGRGTELPDPDGLLEGTGKKARHVKLRTPEDVDNPAVRSLMQASMEATKKAMEKKKR